MLLGEPYYYGFIYIFIKALFFTKNEKMRENDCFIVVIFVIIVVILETVLKTIEAKS